MANRYDVRIPKQMKIKITGVDRHGNAFTQTASTINVSKTGARIEGLGCLDSAQTIEVSCGWFKKARFKVVWVGASEVGIRALDPGNNIWGVTFPPGEIREWRDLNAPPDKAAAPALPDSGPIPVNFSSGPVTYARDFSSSGPTLADHQDRSAQAAATATAPARTPGKPLRERQVPVLIRWSANGSSREERCPTARILRDRSCMATLNTAIAEGSEVQVVNAYTSQARPGKVTLCAPANPSGYQVAIDLDKADPAFWDPGPAVH